MLKDLFPKKKRYATVASNTSARDKVPEGLMEKCKQCGQILFAKELEKQVKTCPHCGYHFTLSAPERIQLTLDEGSFVEFDDDLLSGDPLHFPDYPARVERSRQATGLTDAVLTGTGTIIGYKVVIAAMDSRFIMGSMGSVVGEKLTRAIEQAIADAVPMIIFSVSGGARMQEGIFSLMQMAKVSTALARLDALGLLYISVLTHPTTGGVTASFAMQGDVNLAEPGATIGFAGRRIIEQTIRQKLPDEFQTAEFVMEHGMIDQVVHRKDLRAVLGTLVSLHDKGGEWSGR